MRIQTQLGLILVPLLAFIVVGAVVISGIQAGLLVGGTGGLLLGVGVWTLKRLLRPVDDFVRVAEDISQGKYGAMVSLPKTTEIGQLARSLNRLSAVLLGKTRGPAIEQIFESGDVIHPESISFQSSKPVARRTRVLFFGEAVTLAHVARPMMLARALDPSRYEVLFACDPRFLKLFGKIPFPVRRIHSLSTPKFFDKLKKISPIFDLTTLRAYVKEDLEVIREFRPDLIVGDFRLSLAISAPAAQCPTLQIMNAYWNDSATQAMPVPDEHKVPRLLFELAQPAVLAWHRGSINQLRQEYRLPPLKNGIGQSCLWGDHVLYPDVPEMVPIPNLPLTHHFLGPIQWVPQVNLPEWWDQIPTDKPLVYVGLGSSGRDSALPIILEALSTLPVSVLVATGGRPLPSGLGDNIYAATYLPGDQAAQRAHLVVCNGGSPATQQALAVGTPVLGVASNIDQCMNMEAVCGSRAGELIQAEGATVQEIRQRVLHMLKDPGYSEAAAQLAKTFARYDAPAQFRTLVDKLMVHSPAKSPTQITSA